MRQPLFVNNPGSETEKPNPTNVGGQAVIEGVMMRAPGSLSIVCRKRDGSLVLRERTVSGPATGFWKAPFFRGVYTLGSSLKIGNQALRFSAEILEEGLVEEEEAEAKAGKPVEKKKAPPGLAVLTLTSIAQWLLSSPTEEVEDPAPEKKAPQKRAEPRVEKVEKEEKSSMSGLAMALPILLAVGLFFFLPQLAADGINALFKLGLDRMSPGYQAITGAAKLTIVIGYLTGIRMIPDVRRVFQYHGAEHKSISTYEGGKDLLVEHARPTSALHARCGTTFIIMMAFVSVVVFSMAAAFLPPIPGPGAVQFLALFLLKLPLIPVIAGITYEIQRVFAKYCLTGPLQALLWPGFLVQKITTAEPDDDQLEVALASLRSALANAPVKLPEEHPDREYESYSDLVQDVVPSPRPA